MKRTERHHLKENELAHLASSARDVVGARKNVIMPAVLVIAVIAVAAAGYFTWRGRVEGRADKLLAEALLVGEARISPPAATGQPLSGLSFTTVRERDEAALNKFKIVADQYP